MSYLKQADFDAGRRADRGAVAWQSGLAAEMSVARRYERGGCTIAAHRWRKGGGELDLVLRDGAAVIFVEVKKARDFARAAESLSPRQMRRLYQGAEAFLAGEPAGECTECRFDVALVNQNGEIRILENAF